MFPLSAQKSYVCKECMFEKFVASIEANNFLHDRVAADLRQWWLQYSSEMGGVASIHRFIFAHLFMWYLLLRARPYGVMVVSYAELMLLRADDLHSYLNRR